MVLLRMAETGHEPVVKSAYVRPNGHIELRVEVINQFGERCPEIQVFVVPPEVRELRLMRHEDPGLGWCLLDEQANRVYPAGLTPGHASYGAVLSS